MHSIYVCAFVYSFFTRLYHISTSLNAFSITSKFNPLSWLVKMCLSVWNKFIYYLSRNRRKHITYMYIDYNHWVSKTITSHLSDFLKASVNHSRRSKLYPHWFSQCVLPLYYGNITNILLSKQCAMWKQYLLEVDKLFSTQPGGIEYKQIHRGFRKMIFIGKKCEFCY
jgi:hypothetical protein